jgi:hypothetical protein
MNQGRITKIRKYVRIADEHEVKASEHNWMAAELIWEEIDSGTPQKEIAQAIGKSEAHVSFVKRCWQLRVVDTGLEGFAFGDLGSFYEFYNSSQVRGESAGGDHGGGSGSGDRRKPSGDYSASGLVTQAYTAIDALIRVPSHHELLTDEDLDRLRELPARIRALLRTIG